MTDPTYPPDFVSAETLAYRLDLSRSTIDAYVKAGLLPKPELIGNVQRWEFAAVVAFIRTRNPASDVVAINGVSPGADAYSVGIKRGTAA
jgi:predicted DNA-binding transcriptional regulator AlpA